jgi:hypothetical protein|tara:strand:- start:767 stop:1216 length:450 start_codon:yes stop_codon:yes gene_type:complete
MIDSNFHLFHPAVMSTAPEEKKAPVGKIIGCGCLALFVAGILGVTGLFFGVFKILKSNDAYGDAITTVQSSPAAVAALGEPIKPGWFPSGSISTNNGEGEVDVQISVSGPDGKGTIHVRGKKPAGAEAWIYDTRELRVEGQPEPIPLGK